MLIKKLMIFGLISIIAFGVTVSNTTISLAAPTKAEESNDMIQKIKTKDFNRLEYLIRISEEEYIEAVSLIKQIDSLKKTGKQIEEIKKNVRFIINQLICSLQLKDCKNIATMLRILSEDISTLEKQEPTAESVLGRLDNLIKQDFLDQIEYLVSSIETQRNNLSSENITESTSSPKQPTSHIVKLDHILLKFFSLLKK